MSKFNQKYLLKELILSTYYHSDNIKYHLVDCVFLILYSPYTLADTELQWTENTFSFYQFKKVGTGLLSMLEGKDFWDGYYAYESKVHKDKIEYVRKRVVTSVLVFLLHLNELQVLEHPVEYYMNWLESNGFEWINPRSHDKLICIDDFFKAYLPEEILSFKGKRLGYLYANISLFEEYYITEYSKSEWVQHTIHRIKTDKALQCYFSEWSWRYNYHD